MRVFAWGSGVLAVAALCIAGVVLYYVIRLGQDMSRLDADARNSTAIIVANATEAEVVVVQGHGDGLDGFDNSVVSESGAGRRWLVVPPGDEAFVPYEGSHDAGLGHCFDEEATWWIAGPTAGVDIQRETAGQGYHLFEAGELVPLQQIGPGACWPAPRTEFVFEGN